MLLISFTKIIIRFGSFANIFDFYLVTALVSPIKPENDITCLFIKLFDLTPQDNDFPRIQRL